MPNEQKPKTTETNQSLSNKQLLLGRDGRAVDAFRPNIESTDSTIIQCVEDTGPFIGASQITVSWRSGA